MTTGQIALNLKAIALLDELHEEIGRRSDPLNDYDRIGVILAILRDGYDPDENL
jgi:hypothetical protein